MITEDYVSFETAKLLKEKGFDSGACKNSPHFAYNANGQFSGPSWDTKYPAPTLQMAMKWLREKYKIYYDTGYDDLGWFCNILYIDNAVPVEERPKMIKIKHSFAGHNSFEEACEAAIKYCLENLI